MCADWSLPGLGSSYSDFKNKIHDKIVDAAKMFRGVTATNLPDGVVRFNDTSKKWEVYSSIGGTWSALCSKYGIDVDTTDGFHASQSPVSAQIPVLDSTGDLILANGSSLTSVSKYINDIKLRRFNIKNYGAVCDGTTDDTAAIQAAVNAAMLMQTLYWANDPGAATYVAGAELFIPNSTMISKPISVLYPYWHSKLLITCATQAVINIKAGFTDKFVFKVNAASHTFSTSTSGNPAAGAVRLNNATPSAATAIVLNVLDRFGNDTTPYFASVGNVAVGSTVIQILEESGMAGWSYTISGTPTVSGGILTIPVTYVSGTAGTLSNSTKVIESFGLGRGEYPSTLFRDVYVNNNNNWASNNTIQDANKAGLVFSMTTGMSFKNYTGIGMTNGLVYGPLYCDNTTFENCYNIDGDNTGWMCDGQYMIAGDYFSAISCGGGFRIKGNRGATFLSCKDQISVSYCAGVYIAGHHAEWAGHGGTTVPWLYVKSSVVKVDSGFFCQASEDNCQVVYIDDDSGSIGSHVTMQDNKFEFAPSYWSGHSTYSTLVKPSIKINVMNLDGTLVLRNNYGTMLMPGGAPGNNGFLIGATDSALNTVCQNAARMFTENTKLQYTSGVWKFVNNAVGDGLEVCRALNTPVISSVGTIGGGVGNLAAATYYYRVAISNASGTTPACAEFSQVLGATGCITFKLTANAYPCKVTVFRSTTSGNYTTGTGRVFATVYLTAATSTLYDMGGSLSGYAWGTTMPALPTANTTSNQITYLDGMDISGAATNNTATAAVLYIDGTLGTDEDGFGTAPGTSAFKTFKYGYGTLPDVAGLMDVTIYLYNSVGRVTLTPKVLNSLYITGINNIVTDVVAHAIGGTSALSWYADSGYSSALIGTFGTPASVQSGNPPNFVVQNYTSGAVYTAGNLHTALTPNTMQVTYRHPGASIDGNADGDWGCIDSFLSCPVTIDWVKFTNFTYGVVFESKNSGANVNLCQFFPNSGGVGVYGNPGIPYSVTCCYISGGGQGMVGSCAYSYNYVKLGNNSAKGISALSPMDVVTLDGGCIDMVGLTGSVRAVDVQGGALRIITNPSSNIQIYNAITGINLLGARLSGYPLSTIGFSGCTNNIAGTTTYVPVVVANGSGAGVLGTTLPSGYNTTPAGYVSVILPSGKVAVYPIWTSDGAL